MNKNKALLLFSLIIFFGSYFVQMVWVGSLQTQDVYSQYVGVVKSIEQEYDFTRDMVQQQAKLSWYYDQSLLPQFLPEGVNQHKISREGVVAIIHEEVSVFMEPYFDGRPLVEDQNHGKIVWFYQCKRPQESGYSSCPGLPSPPS